MNEIYCSCHTYYLDKQYQSISRKDVSMRATSIPRRNVNCKRIDPFFDGAIFDGPYAVAKLIILVGLHVCNFLRMARLHLRFCRSHGLVGRIWVPWYHPATSGLLVHRKDLLAGQGCEMVTNQRHVGRQTEQHCLAVSYNHHVIAQLENCFCI